MRLPASLSCAFCASIFSLSAWGYTTTWTTADYFDWTWPAGDPLPTNYQQSCANTGSTASACNVQGVYAGAQSTASADSYSIGLLVMLGASEIASGARASASASIDDWFAFAPDPGQNPAVQAEMTLSILPRTTGWEVGWRGTFEGLEINGGGEHAVVTVPYTGDPFEVTVNAIADGSADNYEGGMGIFEFYLLPTTMLDANGNTVTGTLTLVPEPGYWPIIAALVLGFAVIGRLKLGRFRA